MARRPKKISRAKRLRHRLEVAAFVAVAAGVCRLSRGGARWVGERLGILMFYMLGRERRIALANLEVAFGAAHSPAERRRIARASFQNSVGTMVASLWASRFRDTDIRGYVENGEEFARANACQTGRGLIMLTLHYGDWELLGLAAPALGMQVAVVARELPNTALARRLVALRAVTGNTIIPHRGAARRMFQTLRRGGAVAMLADLNGRRDTGGVWVNFFGVPVFNNYSVAALALRTGAAICLMVGEPLPGGRVRVRSHGRIDFTPSGNYEQDVQQLSQLCLSAGEAFIRERPELWLWSCRRWRWRPTPTPGRHPFYSSYKDMGISPPA